MSGRVGWPSVEDHLFAMNIVKFRRIVGVLTTHPGPFPVEGRGSPREGGARFGNARSGVLDLNFFYCWHYFVCADGVSGSWARRISLRRSRREIVSTDCVS